jgi:hypothetical protein
MHQPAGKALVTSVAVVSRYATGPRDATTRRRTRIGRGYLDSRKREINWWAAVRPARQQRHSSGERGNLDKTSSQHPPSTARNLARPDSRHVTQNQPYTLQGSRQQESQTQRRQH